MYSLSRDKSNRLNYPHSVLMERAGRRERKERRGGDKGKGKIEKRDREIENTDTDREVERDSSAKPNQTS